MDINASWQVTNEIKSILRMHTKSYKRVVGTQPAFEDMLQQVMLVTVEEKFTLRDESWPHQLRAWVIRVGKNYCKRKLQQRKRNRPAVGSAENDPVLEIEDDRAPDATVESREFQRLFREVLRDDQLKPRHRTVIFLKYCGKTTKWIADAFGMRAPAVDTWFHRAKRAFRQRWVARHGPKSWTDYFPDDEQDREGPAGPQGPDFPNDEQDRESGNNGHERGIGE